MPINSIKIKSKFPNGFLSSVGHSDRVYDTLNPQRLMPTPYAGRAKNYRIIHIMTGELLVESIVNVLPDNLEAHFQGQPRNEAGVVGWFDTIDLNELLRSRGYTTGQFKCCIYYLRENWSQVRMFIKQISGNRKEYKIQPQVLPSALTLPTDYADLFKYANQVALWWQSPGSNPGMTTHHALPSTWKSGQGGDSGTNLGANFEEFGNFVLGFHNRALTTQNSFGFHEKCDPIVDMKVSGWNNLPALKLGRFLVNQSMVQGPVPDPNHMGINTPGYPDDDKYLVPVVTGGGLIRPRNGIPGEDGFMALNNYIQGHEKLCVLVKTLSPIDKSVKVGDRVSLSFLLTEPREVNVKLIKTINVVTGNKLAPPNFQDKTHAKIVSSDYESWDTILSSSVDTKQDLLNTIFSGSNIGQAQLNIDYRKFDNFVHFGSAEERVKNFKFKLQLLEYYDEKIGSLESVVSSGSYWSLRNVEEYDSKKNKIKNGFDGYERFLYYSSGSGFHGQTPVDEDVVWLDNKKDYPVASWPKSSIQRPYDLYSVSSSTATSWYDGMITSASLYDGLNEHNLDKLIPEHIALDPLNENYFTFVSMIGQQFDTLYNYVDHLTKVNKRDEYIYEGLSKNLIYETLKSYGWEPVEGYRLEDLFSYALGKDKGGGYLGKGIGSMQVIGDQGNDVYGEEILNPFVVASIQSQQAGSQSFYDIPSPASESITKEEVTKEQWKRILNNLPHLGQTKGTERSIRALLNTYGLPPSILRIKEYGGIPKSGSANQLLPRDQFKYALDFTGSQQVQTPWLPIDSNYATNGYDSQPNLIEFRFNTSYPQHQLIVWGSGSHANASPSHDAWAIEIEAHHSASSTTSGYFKHGRLNIYAYGDASGSGTHRWISASTEYLPMFDNDWWNVQVGPRYRSDNSYDNNKFKLLIAKASDYGNGRITHSGSAETEEIDEQTFWPGASSAVSYWNPHYLFWGSNHSGSYDASTHEVPVAMRMMTGSMVPAASSSTTGGNEHGSGYFHWGFSGSLQEIRYWDTEGYGTEPLTHESFLPTPVWENHVRDPLSIEAQYYTSSYKELVRRWPLGLDGAKHQMSSSGGYATIESTHPRGSYVPSDFAATSQTWVPAAWHLSASGFTGTSDDWTAEEERMFTMMPEIIGQSVMGDKIRIDNTSITGSLSPFRSVQSSSLNLASKDSNIVGVYFSPNDMVDIDIARTIGGTKFGDFVGNPMDTRSGSYAELREISQAYWQKYKTSPTFTEYMNVLRFFDDSMFSQIEKLLPARVNPHLGVLIKPNLLERPKFQWMPTETIELVTYSGSTKVKPKLSGYPGSEFDGSGGHTGFIRGFSSQEIGGIGSMAIGESFQVYGQYQYNPSGVRVDLSSQQTVGYISVDLDVRDKFGRDIDDVGFWETPSYITSQSGHFVIGETTSDDIPLVHSQRKSKKFKKQVFAMSSSINALTGLPQKTVTSHSLIEVERQDAIPLGLDRLFRLGVKHGSISYEIGGNLINDRHDSTLVGVGLRKEYFAVVEVVITKAIDLFPDDLPESALGMGGGYTIGGAGNEFIELNFPESFIDDPSAGSGLGTYGCTDPGACNFNPMATNSDGYCLYPGNPLCPGTIFIEPAGGCTHPGATNYWCNINPCPNGIVPYTVEDDGSCTFPVEIIEDMVIDVAGCTDPIAINYEIYATIDSGVCEYETVYDAPYGCNDPVACNYVITATGDVDCIYPGHPNCPQLPVIELIYGCTDMSYDSWDPSATAMSLDMCYNDPGEPAGAGTNITGCCDPNANNFDLLATQCSALSCKYSQGMGSQASSIAGCTDTTALNYNSNADTDDGSCEYSSGEWNSRDEDGMDDDGWDSDVTDDGRY